MRELNHTVKFQRNLNTIWNLKNSWGQEKDLTGKEKSKEMLLFVRGVYGIILRDA